MKSICQCCKGKGALYVFLRQSKTTPYRFAKNDNLPEEHYVTCRAPGCNNGIVDHEEYRRIIGLTK
jgi:hypothetical protein